MDRDPIFQGDGDACTSNPGRDAMKKTISLRPEDLRVETFAVVETPATVDMTTRWPKDCPESYPRVC